MLQLVSFHTEYCEQADEHRCVNPYYTKEDCSVAHLLSICPAMCGQCKASTCKDQLGQQYAVGESWISKNGRITCTEAGMQIVSGKGI